jgi:hypothetical protein
MMTVKMIQSRGNERRNHVVSHSRGVIDAFNAPKLVSPFCTSSQAFNPHLAVRNN